MSEGTIVVPLPVQDNPPESSLQQLLWLRMRAHVDGTLHSCRIVLRLLPDEPFLVDVRQVGLNCEGSTFRHLDFGGTEGIWLAL